MPEFIQRDTGSYSDAQYQEYILQGVSRTFALTIPQLPKTLHHSVGNAYLLCRIADTIEDDPEMTLDQKVSYSKQFLEVLKGDLEADAFTRSLQGAVSSQQPPGERDLIANIARVVRVTHALKPGVQKSLLRCVEVMSQGMSEFQRVAAHGLTSKHSFERYCYFVAGIVGETFTQLYLEYAPEMRGNKAELMRLSKCFGEGLQITNILMDLATDYRRGVCWLPRETFHDYGVDLSKLPAAADQPGFKKAVSTIVAQAHMDLRAALEYTLLIPSKEVGVRRFCFWSIGLALLSLKNFQQSQSFISNENTKISRYAVKKIILLSKLCVTSDKLTRLLFNYLSAGLPLASIEVQSGQPI